MSFVECSDFKSWSEKQLWWLFIPNIWLHCSKIPLNCAETISSKIQDCYLQVVRQSSTQDTHQWLVILLPKMAHFCTGNLEPLGPVQYKKKMLEALGFKVIVIYLFEYKDAQRARKTRNLLLDKIHSIAKAKLWWPVKSFAHGGLWIRMTLSGPLISYLNPKNKEFYRHMSFYCSVSSLDWLNSDFLFAIFVQRSILTPSTAFYLWHHSSKHVYQNLQHIVFCST